MKKLNLLLTLPFIFVLAGWMGSQEEKPRQEVAELSKKWLTVKGWQGTYSSTYKNEKIQDMGNGLTVTTSISTRLSASAVMDQYCDGEPPGFGIAELCGVGSASWEEFKDTKMVFALEGGEMTIRETIKTESSGKIGGGEDEDEWGGNILIDCYTGTYSVGFAGPNTEGTSTVTRSITGVPTNFSVLQQAPEPYASLFGGMGVELEAWANYSGPLEGAGTMMTGVMSILAMPLMPDFNRPTEYELPKSGMVLVDSYSSANETETWRVFPVGMGQMLELQKCEDIWYPVPGDIVAINVTGSGWNGEAAKLRMTLFEVSNRDGMGINYLGDERPRDAFDLDFDTKFNKGILEEQEETEDGFVVETVGYVMNSTFFVASYDGAAWGKLKVEAQTKDSDEWYPIFTPELDEYITIPLDERGGFENYIADYWEESHHLDEVVNGLEDDEIGMGDGLSLFEEYRGFYTTERHGLNFKRCDPTKIDYFLFCNDRQLAAAAKNAEDAFPLQVNILGDPLRAPGKVVNVYSDEFKNGDQHYVVMFRGNIADSCVTGVTQGYGDKFTPGTTIKIVIDTDEISRIEANLEQTVVHEMFHSMGVGHHGPGSEMSTIPLPGDHNPFIQYVVARYHGTNSGMVECIMCYVVADYYTDATGVVKRGDDNKPILFVGTKDKRRSDTLCVDRTGTGPNTGGEQVGDAARGTCYGQVYVKDY